MAQNSTEKTCAKTAGQKTALIAEGNIVKKVGSKTSSNLTPKNYFGSKTHSEMETILTNKFGLPKGGGSFNKSFYNPKTERTFNLHWDPLHRGGRPHIDIRKRGLNTDFYKD